MKNYNPYLIPFYIPYEGCPHKCIYCNSELASYGESGEINREYFNKRVNAFLETRKSRGSHCEIAFYGGSFNSLSEEIRNCYLNLTRPFLNNGKVDSIRVSIRPGFLTEDILASFVDLKIKAVELGVQSMNAATLKKIGRDHDCEDIVNTIKNLRKNSILICAHLMVGLPGESGEDFLKSLSSLIGLKPDFLRFHPTVVLKDTRLEEMYRSGEYTPLSLEEACMICASGYISAMEAGIDVLRMGLQSNEILDSGDAVVAGPWHSSFGEMVYSRVFLIKLEDIIIKKNLQGITKIGFKVNPRDVSKTLGHGKSNIKALKIKYGIKEIYVSADSDVRINRVELI